MDEIYFNMTVNDNLCFSIPYFDSFRGVCTEKVYYTKNGRFYCKEIIGGAEEKARRISEETFNNAWYEKYDDIQIPAWAY